MIEMIKINLCIHDWKSYNEGKGNWKWFELPTQESELLDHLDAMQEKGLEEPFICDYEAPFKIGEHASIGNLVEIAYFNESDLLDTLDPYDNELSEIYFMDDFDDFASHFFTDFYDAFTSGLAAKFNWHDDYFKVNGNGHVETISEKEYDRIKSRTLQQAFENFNY